jgi:hypothetical protein
MTKLIGIFLLLGGLCIPSCGRKITNIDTEFFYRDHGGDSLAFGRIGVVEDGIEKTWAIPRGGTADGISFKIFIRGRESSLEASHYLTKDGYFYLRLAPGEYTIWKWIYRFPGGEASSIEPLTVSFDVLPGKMVYIGTLYLYLPAISSGPLPSLGAERAKPRYDIVDEYGTAIRLSRNRYPNFPSSAERHLMLFSH